MTELQFIARNVEVRIGGADLAAKLDAIGAVIAAVREAHRDDMSATSWAALQRAQEAIAEAILSRHERGPQSQSSATFPATLNAP